MKLSDAIMLGSTKTKLNPDRWLTSDGTGCLIGIGISAICELHDIPTWGGLDNEILVRFPWLRQDFPVPEIAKGHDDVWGHLNGFKFTDLARAVDIISRMAYLVKAGRMTLEQAVDWIRSVEPPDPPAEVPAIDVACNDCANRWSASLEADGPKFEPCPKHINERGSMDATQEAAQTRPDMHTVR